VFDHVTIRVSNRETSERFYETVLRAIGVERTHSGEWFAEWGDFSISQASEEKAVTRRLHVAFFAPSRELVDEFWRTGTSAGHRDDGESGERPQYSDDYYGAFLLDPDGNSAEAVHHGRERRAGQIDHLWIRVADVDASKRFYETIAPVAGIRVRPVEAFSSVQAVGEAGSLMLFPGEPTQHVHMAFPAGDNAIVDEFHRVATAAGYRDNGRPGERPIYHAGYYGAFVLDPDGNNVEVVNHNR